MDSMPGSHQTPEQSLSSTTLIVCVVLQRRVLQQKLLYSSIICYRTLILFRQWLLPGVGATWMRMWKSLSSTSLCFAGSCHRPWSGIQGCEEGEWQLAWLLRSCTACLWLPTPGIKQQWEASPHTYTRAVVGDGEQIRHRKLSQFTPFYHFPFFSPPGRPTPDLCRTRKAQKSKWKSTGRFYTEDTPGSLETSRWSQNSHSLSLSTFLGQISQSFSLFPNSFFFSL